MKKFMNQWYLNGKYDIILSECGTFLTEKAKH